MISYPIKKKTAQKTVNYANLGMTLESDIDVTNRYYRDEGIAVIHKKPTPIQVVSVSYPARNKAKITEAYYKVPSTTDFNGIFEGRYIDFDAKETTLRTSMPLKNIHSHQVDHLKAVEKSGGIAFLIVHFKRLQVYYLLPALVLFRYWDTRHDPETGRKSIPLSTFEKEAYLIPFSFQPRLDYLSIVKTHLMSK
jgi:recombination protein U